MRFKIFSLGYIDPSYIVNSFIHNDNLIVSLVYLKLRLLIISTSHQLVVNTQTKSNCFQTVFFVFYNFGKAKPSWNNNVGTIYFI